MARMFALAGLAGLGVCIAIPFPAFAQNYPARPIRIVVGFQAGGGSDTAARTLGKYLTEALGQPIIVENRPGAAGNLSADVVAKSPPDGYTLLLSNSTISMPSLFIKLPFDVNKDLVPVSLVSIGPSVLVVHPSVPARNVKELIALAKAKPKQVLYGSGGVGNITHLQMELFAATAGVDMIHVPYKGGAPSVVGLMSGEVHTLFSAIVSALPQIRAGRVRPLGVTVLQRVGTLPNVPTLDEAGMKGYNAASWYGLFAPAGVSGNTLGILSKEIAKTMRIPELREKFASDGFEPVGNSPQEFAGFLREEIPKWAKLAKAIGLKPE